MMLVSSSMIIPFCGFTTLEDAYRRHCLRLHCPGCAGTPQSQTPASFRRTHRNHTCESIRASASIHQSRNILSAAGRQVSLPPQILQSNRLKRCGEPRAILDLSACSASVAMVAGILPVIILSEHGLDDYALATTLTGRTPERMNRARIVIGDFIRRFIHISVHLEWKWVQAFCASRLACCASRWRFCSLSMRIPTIALILRP